MRQQLPLPFGLKGIMTAHDARLAVEHGVDFIWVSNHGGRQIDDGRASIDALIEIAEVVDGRVPLVIDSGFRRATDAMKALALGATLVAFGRVAAWGLAVGGAEGVQRTLRLLQRRADHQHEAVGPDRDQPALAAPDPTHRWLRLCRTHGAVVGCKLGMPKPA